jgi:hypothetical protein
LVFMNSRNEVKVFVREQSSSETLTKCYERLNAGVKFIDPEFV